MIYETGRFAEAEPYHLETLEGCRRVHGPEHIDTLTAETNLGVLLHSMGRAEEAEEIFRSSLETKRRVLGNDHPQTLININSLAVALEAQGEYDEAEPLYLEGLEGYRRVFGDVPSANLEHPLQPRGIPDRSGPNRRGRALPEAMRSKPAAGFWVTTTSTRCSP